MNAGRNFLRYLAQAIDRNQAGRRATSGEEISPQPRSGQVRRFLRWLTPNGGTLLLVVLLILTQNVWARRPAAPTTAISAVATTVNYQGHLADSNGNPLNDTVSLTFAIYDAETGGNVIWGPETHAAVDVQDGLFSVGLGTIQPLSADVWTGGDRYLEITVDGQTLSPREPIRAVPFAQMAGELDGRLEDKLHVSGDAHPPNEAWPDYTLSLAETTNQTGNKATIRFENAGIAQGYIRLDGSYTDRKFVFGDDQGAGMDGEFTGGLYVKGKGIFGTPGQGEGGEIQLVEGAGGIRWYMDNYNNTLRWFNTGGDPSPNDVMYMQPSGDFWVKGSISHGGSIENNLMTPEEQQASSISRFSQGDLLCWDAEGGRLEKCAAAASPLVVAVADENGKPIVLGAEPVKVLGPVQPGDLLVASDVPGYAIAWSQVGEGSPPVGVVIAKALAGFDGARGTIKAMILGR